MTTEQKQNMQDALDAEKTTLVVDLDNDQLEVAATLGRSIEQLNAMARNAFASSLRGLLQASIDKTIKAKYHAISKNKAALAEECENEIQQGLRLKARIS